MTKTSRLLAELREAQAHFRCAFEDAPIGMAVVGLDGRIAEANESLATLSGLSRETLQASSLTELVHTDDRADVGAQMQATLSGEAERQAIEARLMHRCGAELSVSLHASLLHAGGGRPERVLVQLQDVTEQRAFEQQLTFLVDHDHLTSLYNRRRFEQEVDRHLAQCRRFGADGALALIDIDEFRLINDAFGHAAGDAVIVQVAEILSARLRESDVVARLGGDEFAVLLPSADREEAETAMCAVLEEIRREARAGDATSSRAVTVSVGLTLFPESRGSSLDGVLAAAEVALDEAKQSGRDRVATFD